MQILLMAQHYAPEEVSGAVLATELAEDLVKQGHQVTFVTCAPNYPEGRVFAGYRNRLLQVETLNGVRIVRVWSYISPRKSFWRRVFNFATFSFMALWGGLLEARPEVLLSYSPPLPLGIAAWLTSRLKRVPWVLRVEDLYPEAAIAAGVLRSRRAAAFFEWLERFLYQRADHISLISDGFQRNLVRKRVTPGKLSVIPVWADPAEVCPSPKANAFRRENDLDGSFVVMYAGNLGYASAVEDVVAAAELLSTRSDISFVFVGEGVKKATLQIVAQDRQLRQVKFLPFQPRDRFPEMMAAADVSLVTLNRDSSGTSLPSKTFSIMASGRPIVAVTPPDSEIAHLVNAAGCGVVVAPAEPAALAAIIVELSQSPDRLDEMGRKGRVQLESRYARQRCVAQFEAMLVQVAG